MTVSCRLLSLGPSNSRPFSLLGKLLIRFQNASCFEKQIYKLSPVNYTTPFIPRTLRDSYSFIHSHGIQETAPLSTGRAASRPEPADGAPLLLCPKESVRVSEPCA